MADLTIYDSSDGSVIWEGIVDVPTTAYSEDGEVISRDTATVPVTAYRPELLVVDRGLEQW